MLRHPLRLLALVALLATALAQAPRPPAPLYETRTDHDEFDFPYEMMRNMLAGLKPGGRIIFVEYRLEDPAVPIKRLHKMSEVQIKREMSAHPELEYVETVATLPRQHIMVFRKK
jgi:hypothetical protein